MARTNSVGKIIDSKGNIAPSDVLVGYKNVNTEENSGDATSYYGFVDTEGNWFIMKRVKLGTASEITYSRGTTNYSTNWTNRAGLSYAAFDITF